MTKDQVKDFTYTPRYSRSSVSKSFTDYSQSGQGLVWSGTLLLVQSTLAPWSANLSRVIGSLGTSTQISKYGQKLQLQSNILQLLGEYVGQGIRLIQLSYQYATCRTKVNKQIGVGAVKRGQARTWREGVGGSVEICVIDFSCFQEIKSILLKNSSSLSSIY